MSLSLFLGRGVVGILSVENIFAKRGLWMIGLGWVGS